MMTDEYKPSEQVQQFNQLALLLIDAAGGYAAGGVYNANNEAMMRQLRVTTAALNVALSSIPQNMRTPPPPPTPVEPEPQAAAKAKK